MRCVSIILLITISICSNAQPSGDSFEANKISGTVGLYAQNGRVGLQKSKNKPITPAVYDTLYQIHPTLYIGRRYSSSKQQSLWGVIDASGKRVIPFKYIRLEVLHDYVIVGYQEKNIIKYGVSLLNGTELLLPIYESISILEEYIAASKDNQSLVFNQLGIKLFQLEADSITLLDNGFACYYVRGKAGLAKLNIGPITMARYQDIKVLGDGILVKKLPKWNFIRGFDTLNFNDERIIEWENNFIVSNNNKSWLIDSEALVKSALYDNIIKCNSSFAIVNSRGKYGVINNFGKEIISLNYSQIINDSEVIYTQSFGDDKKWSLFDYYGYQKTKLEYDSIYFISEGRIAVKRNGKWGFLDRFGIEIISPIFDKVSPFKDGLSIVTFFGEDGIINREGKWVALPDKLKICNYSSSTILVMVRGQYQVRSFSGELIYFSRNKLEMNNTGYAEYDTTGFVVRNISWKGTIIPHPKLYNETMAGGAGLIVFRANNKYGFKDQKGRIIIANRYEAVRPYNQNMAAIRINNKWGFIDLDEQLVIQPKYDSVGYFDRGLCITKKNNLQGVVNLIGDEIITNRYQDIILLSNGKFRVRKDNLWGVLDENGAAIIHPKYQQILPVKQNFYIVERHGKYGTIDLNGVNKIPMLYDYIGYNENSKTLVTKFSYKNEWVFLRKTHSSDN